MTEIWAVMRAWGDEGAFELDSVYGSRREAYDRAHDVTEREGDTCYIVRSTLYNDFEGY